jgi:hypothetical protein
MDTKPNRPHDQRSEYLKKSLSHHSTKRHQFEVGLVLILDILDTPRQDFQDEIFETRLKARMVLFWRERGIFGAKIHT